MIKANISWNAAQIAKAATLGSMSFSNAMQRGHVWDIGRKSKFIDSLLRGYVVPAMYTIRTDIDAPEGCKKGSKVFDCIDGKQRSEAIRGFLNDEFALVGLDEVDGEDINGLRFSELSEDMQEAIKSYTMTVYYFTDITDDEVCEMMARLNNGKPLTGVENARIKAKNLTAIITLATHPLFTENMTEAAIRSYHNEDVVIKTALQMFDEQFELSTKNVKTAYENMEFSEGDVAKLDALFDRVKAIIDIVKENSKKLSKTMLKKTNLVGIIYHCSVNMSDGADEDDYEKFAEFFTEFFDAKSDSFCDSRNDYNEAMQNGTNHASNVIARNDAMQEAYDVFG